MQNEFCFTCAILKKLKYNHLLDMMEILSQFPMTKYILKICFLHPIQNASLFSQQNAHSIIYRKSFNHHNLPWLLLNRIAKPEKSSHGSSADEPGKYLPKSITVVTPLVKARLLALKRASLLSSTETSGMQDKTSFMAESINNPVGSAFKIPKTEKKMYYLFLMDKWVFLGIEL